MDTGWAATKALPPHPFPTRPYYTANRPTKAVYRRGRGGCGRGDGALVAARPCPPPHLFSLFEMYWLFWPPAGGGRRAPPVPGEEQGTAGYLSTRQGTHKGPHSTLLLPCPYAIAGTVPAI